MKMHTVDISSPKLISPTVATKDKTQSRWDISIPEKKPLVVHYNKEDDKAKTRWETPENVQKCLEDMRLDFSKYKQFKVWQYR